MSINNHQFKFICGDSYEELKELPDNSVDSVVTDPPYGLGEPPDPVKVMGDWVEKGYHDIKGKGFMGKEWDKFVPQPALWKECYRVGNRKATSYEIGQSAGKYQQPQGRFPANLILSNEEQVKRVFPNTSKGWSKATNGKAKGSGSMIGIGGTNANRYDMGGTSAARFFKQIEGDRVVYQSKPSKKERGSYNTHSTVKPVKLMVYLTRLVTPKGGIVLDPFMGSGTTGIACKENGFGFIGIDNVEDYIKLSKKRIQNWSVGWLDKKQKKGKNANKESKNKTEKSDDILNEFFE